MRKGDRLTYLAEASPRAPRPPLWTWTQRRTLLCPGEVVVDSQQRERVKGSQPGRPLMVLPFFFLPRFFVRATAERQSERVAAMLVMEG